MEEGWELTRDGSTATARYTWDDPDDPDAWWEVLVLHTSGHPARVSVRVEGGALSECAASRLDLLRRVLGDAQALVAKGT